jgi:hypothetical protein
LDRILELRRTSSVIDALLDEVVRLCANCDPSLGMRLETILRRSHSPVIRSKISQSAGPVLAALRILIYVSEERGVDTTSRLDQVDACIDEIVAWYRKKLVDPLAASPVLSVRRSRKSRRSTEHRTTIMHS